MLSTDYDVRIRYAVDNRAAAGVRAVTNDVKALGRQSNMVTSSMMRMGAAIVGAFGVRAAGKALVGFNATAQDTKIQIAGMLALTKKTDLVDQIGAADRLFANLQRRAKTLPGTTQEYTQMAGMLTQPITDAGLGLKDIEDLTVNSVVGAKALGIAWDVAARDMDQALRGQFHSTDQFTGKLLGGAGYKGEEGRAKYNAMSASERADVLKAALRQKQLTQLAAAQGNTFTGTLSTLQDTVQQFLGKVGLPLFKAITIELKQWNSWFDGNEGKVDAFAARFADGLATGFKVVKDAVSFLVDHADTLLTIGKVWAGVKIGGMLAGGIASGVGSARDAVGSAMAWGRGAKDNGRTDGSLGWEGGYKYEGAGAGRSSWKSGAGGAMGALPAVGQALAAGYAVGTAFNELTGASGLLADSLARLKGQSDGTAEKFEAQERAKALFDKETGVGSNGRDWAANMKGLIQNQKNDLNAVADFQREMAKGPTTNWLGHVKMTDAQERARDAMTARGLDPANYNAKTGAGEIARLEGVLATTSATSLNLWLQQFHRLNGTQQKGLDIAGNQLDVLNYIRATTERGVD